MVLLLLVLALVALAPAAAAEEPDEMGLLQNPIVAPGEAQASTWPVLIPLRKETVPVAKNGKTVAHKTSYSGAVSVGRPAQEFRVVFDTGSGHVIVPSSDCESESCLAHRRYSLAASKTGTAVNVDGTEVPHDEYGDQVTVGFATGQVTGEFVREQVCMNGPDAEHEVCVEVSVITAMEMTTQPFKAFQFDGIFGLGLSALAVAPEFNYLHRFAGAGLGAASQFGFFISGGTGGGQEGGEDGGEIAVGGYNAERLLTPLQWAPVAQQEQGHWQVQIKAVRIGNRTLDLCKDGSCRGIVDTGTSHFGVPGAGLKDFQRALTAPGFEDQDCRQAEAPPVTLVLDGFTITLGPENYMRPLPLDAAPPAGGKAKAKKGARSCTPRIMPVNMAAPLGPKLFLLGEPVLHRYYTVYDWKSASIGFGLAATEGNRAQLAKQADEQPQQELQQEEEIFSFMQVTVTVSVRPRKGRRVRAGEGLALPTL